MADDLAHSYRCLRRLADGEFHNDVQVRKALYESALISFRRSIGGDARSMRRDAPGGGVVGRVGKEQFDEILDTRLAALAHRMYELADEHVAHRSPLAQLRSIETTGSGLSGHWNLPASAELELFAEAGEKLYRFVVLRAGLAMSPESSSDDVLDIWHSESFKVHEK